ncbi:ADP-ribosylation/crystallin J1 [Hyphomicrobium sp.]|uniref:ADP-ribosylation/crystallin J1 n=1 Tax=Hyphomicrobium sp. TaxID=82 RepID=UPI003F71A59E
MDEELVTLWRPTGTRELELIAEAGWRAWPPRLQEQPIFYPVTNEGYATQIARDWNTKSGDKKGFVTRFKVRKSYLDRFERKIVGRREHEEYWIPAEGLQEFNANIIGLIELVATYTEADRLAEESKGRVNA